MEKNRRTQRTDRRATNRKGQGTPDRRKYLDQIMREAEGEDYIYTNQDHMITGEAPDGMGTELQKNRVAMAVAIGLIALAGFLMWALPAEANHDGKPSQPFACFELDDAKAIVDARLTDGDEAGNALFGRLFDAKRCQFVSMVIPQNPNFVYSVEKTPEHLLMIATGTMSDDGRKFYYLIDFAAKPKVPDLEA